VTGREGRVVLLGGLGDRVDQWIPRQPLLGQLTESGRATLLGFEDAGITQGEPSPNLDRGIVRRLFSGLTLADTLRLPLPPMIDVESPGYLPLADLDAHLFRLSAAFKHDLQPL